MSGKLDRLAQAYGVAVAYRGQSGEAYRTPDASKHWALEVLGVEVNKPLAQLLSRAPRLTDTPTAPEGMRAFAPQWLSKRRAWGITCQLYALKSARNWGLGDLEDLARLAEIVARVGGDFVGIGPLHAMFLSRPKWISPYSPSSREFLNPLYIAPDRLPGYRNYAKRTEPVLAALRKKRFVDYAGVARVKFAILEKMFADFEASGTRGAGRAAFARYIQAGGESLRNYCLFECLAEYLKKRRAGAVWRNWPPAYRNPHSAECAAFARAAAARMRYFAWLQFLAEEQLDATQSRARAAGMRIGLYLDIAVGISPDGAAAWSVPGAFAGEARLGAPPDPFNARGQNWGLLPLSPRDLRETDGAAFRSSVRVAMRHAGAVRIDHALGMWRLFWIPERRNVRWGTYVRYPFELLTETVAKESRIFRALVIGEDLGAVPPGFSEALNAANILSYRVLYFERGRAGAFLPPSHYPARALACISTQDLPTLAGWWSGDDIALRAKLGRTAKPATAKERRKRRDEKRALVAGLVAEKLLAGDVEILSARPISDEFAVAVHRYLARTKSVLCAVQIEDALGIREQANLPGTVDEYPNWRRRLPVALEDISKHRLFRAVARAVDDERKGQ